MQSNEVVSWGVLGCGDVTEKKSGPAFSKVEGSRLAAVMRRDGAKAKDYAARHGVPFSTDDADTLIHHPDVNAVYIATPPGSHAELALRVAAAGKPCYIEKPMASNTAECALINEAFDKAGVPVFVAYYRRCLPHFAKIRELIQSGEFGPLRQLNYEFKNTQQWKVAELTGWRFDPATAGGGLLWDLGSHALDLFDFWVGPFRNIKGHLIARPGGKVEDIAALNAKAGEADAPAISVSASWNFAAPLTCDRVQLCFDEAIVETSVFGPLQIQIKRPKQAPETLSFETPEHIQQPLINAVVQNLRGGPSAPSTGSTAQRTNAALDAISHP